jgi:hypothetical protein
MGLIVRERIVVIKKEYSIRILLKCSENQLLNIILVLLVVEKIEEAV